MSYLPLWQNKVKAITNLEQSLREDRPRALIQMATGAGKTLLVRRRFVAESRFRADCIFHRELHASCDPAFPFVGIGNALLAANHEPSVALSKGLAEGLAEGLAKGRTEGLIGQVRLCERFLKRAPLPDEQLGSMSADELQRLVEELESQIPS
ncbi:MAG: DEAD/DEAH box helicase family protein [Planctomycetes bacterium]|nr:DEAD/DEAH box helicase family protein [Planctomycetota bacterium]MBL7040031.1 DEAD/DEAH box helicase family protein [Pirellulaceae bacterium]